MNISTEEWERLVRQYTGELLRLGRENPPPPAPAGPEEVSQPSVPAVTKPTQEEFTEDANIDTPPPEEFSTDPAPGAAPIPETGPEPAWEEPPAPVTTPSSAPPAFGRLQVQVYKAGEALPVEGATVTVFAEEDGGTAPLTVATTDRNGFTPAITLPAKPAELSLQPGNPRPFATYTVQVNAPGYFQIIDKQVAVYSGVTSVQPAEMIPLPENFQGDPTLTFEESQPNL